MKQIENGFGTDLDQESLERKKETTKESSTKRVKDIGGDVRKKLHLAFEEDEEEGRAMAA